MKHSYILFFLITSCFIYGCINKSEKDGTPSVVSTAQINKYNASSLKPDCVFIQEYELGPRLGIWMGALSFKLGIPNRLIMPNPNKQIIFIITRSSNGLPKYLQENKVYLWRGVNDFVFIKDIKNKKDIDAITSMLGKEGTVPSELGLAPY